MAWSSEPIYSRIDLNMSSSDSFMSSRSVVLQDEGSLYIGEIVSSMLYGIYIGLYCLSVYALCAKPTLPRLRRILLVLFSSIQLLLNTIFLYSMPLLGQRMWIEHRQKFPAGSLEYYIVENNTAGYMVAGHVAQNLAIFLNSALLVYRCFIVSGPRSLVIMLPMLLLVSAAFGICLAGILLDIELLIPCANKLHTVMITLTIFANIMTTGIISFKILSVSYKLRKHIEGHPKWVTKPYISVVTILVESTAPCAVLGFIMVFLGKTVDRTDGVFLIWSAFMALSQQLITYRVSQRTAWTRTTSKELAHTASTMVDTPRKYNSASKLQITSSQLPKACHFVPNPDTIDKEKPTSISGQNNI